MMAAEDGTPIMEEQAMPEHTWMLPVGGTRELGSHKGYGLGVVAQVFSRQASLATMGPAA
jgi:LDH2 family malate/lactate/ureidoglycolate dehydrogenase